MTYSLINSASAASSNAASVSTTGFDSTGGNLGILAVSGLAGGSSPGAVSDSNSNTWTALTRQAGGSYGVQLFYCLGLTCGASHTASVASVASSRPSIAFYVFKGAKLGATPQQNGATTIAATVQPGSITPSNDNSLIVTAYGGGLSGSVTGVDSSMNEISVGPAGNNVSLGFAYKIQTSAAAINPTWTYSSSTNVNATMGVFPPSVFGPWFLDEIVS